jgi:hypothetical protein
MFPSIRVKALAHGLTWGRGSATCRQSLMGLPHNGAAALQSERRTEHGSVERLGESHVAWSEAQWTEARTVHFDAMRVMQNSLCLENRRHPIGRLYTAFHRNFQLLPPVTSADSPRLSSSSSGIDYRLAGGTGPG